MTDQEVLDRCRPIDGWMYDEELLWLHQQATRCRIIVEIGTWKGRSTAALAMGTPGVVYAVDHWRGSPDELETGHAVMATDEGRESVFFDAMRNLYPFIDAGRCVPIVLSSASAHDLLAPMLRERGGADLIFLDGSHDCESVTGDIYFWRPLVAEGGLLCGHDFPWPGVTKAVSELVGTVDLGPGSIWHKRL